MPEGCVSEPEFTYDRGIATVRWGAPGTRDHVEMTFDSIEPERRSGGGVRAFVVVRNGKPQPIWRAPLSLTGPNAKRDAAADLARLHARDDWRLLLEDACWKVVDAHQTGRPAIRLWDAPDPPDDGQLLPPLLVKNDAVMIFGDGGGAKSYLGLALALSLQTGQPLVGYLRPLARLRVAYLDWEWRPEPHKRRMRALLGPDPDGHARELLYVPCSAEGPLVHQEGRLRRLFHEHRIEYAVGDSAALACDGPPEDAQVALAFFQSLARLEVGSCLLAHVNRQGDQEKPFGSAFWHNSARLTWNVQRASEEDGRLKISLFNRKANDGSRQQPIGLEFQFGERTTINCVEVSSTSSSERKSERQSNRLHDRLAGFLAAARGATYEQARLELGASEDSIRKVIQRDRGQTFITWRDPEDKRITRLGLTEKPGHE
jgi:hypothetical protein